MTARRLVFLASIPLALASCDTADGGRDIISVYDFGGVDTQPADTATDADGRDVDPGVDPGFVPPVSVDGPSAELLIRITGPSGRGFATTTGSLVALTGLVFGPAETVTWSKAGGAGGQVAFSADSPYWLSDAIPLSIGDNRVVVTATGKDPLTGDPVTVTDEIVVTRNPGYLFGGLPQVNPPALFVGQTETVYVTMAVGPFGDLAEDALTLRQVDASGAGNAVLGTMVDDGLVAVSGDEIQGDGVFTVKLSVTCDTAGPRYMRAVALARDGSGSSPYAALSVPARLECVQRISRNACATHQQTLGDARIAYQTTLSSSGDASVARAAAIAALSADGAVVEVAGADEPGGLWVRFDDGVLGALNLAAEGTRGDAADAEAGLASVASPATDVQAVGSKNVMLLSPFVTDFAPNDETVLFSNVANNVSCPSYSVRGPLNSSAAGLAAFRRLSGNGIVAVATHGDIYFRGLADAQKRKMGWRHLGAQEVLWTGERVVCGNLAQAVKTCANASECDAGSECIITTPATEEVKASGVCYDRNQVDLATGRVVMGDAHYGVTPEFIGHYAASDRFPDSLVYLGACRTLYNGTLAGELFAAGVKAVVGFTNRVTNVFAFKQGGQLFSRMVEQAMTTGEAYGVGAQDPDNRGSYFRLFGARNLGISDYDLLNVSFETGDLSAWTREGDGRVITRLGDASPVDGKFMGIISTGLGFTVEIGSATQRFCIPPNAKTLSFYWKYYSEEFVEFCGTAYQDAFLATLIDSKGTRHELVNLTVDDLCPEAKCATCQGLFPLTKADVDFDKKDVYMTDWQKAEFDLAPLLGGQATNAILKFFCTDTGDSIYDTAVLVDRVRIE